MEAGRATPDGVPAHAVRTLDELEASIRERFPRVMEFVRPGFDEAVPGPTKTVPTGAADVIGHASD